MLIGRGGSAMMGDFGCARMESVTQSIGALTSSGTANGTWNYWAPELMDLNGAVHSKASDVWAFGMTVYVSNETRTSRPVQPSYSLFESVF